MTVDGWATEYGQRHPVPMLTVFQAGEDRMLLETRRRVLESIGLTVVTAHGGAETLQRIAQLQFDLAILCHSLPVHQRLQIAATLRKANPTSPILLVGRGPAGQKIDGHSDIDAVVDPDPERLTETLRRLLHLKQQTNPAPERRVSPSAGRGNSDCVDSGSQA